MYIRCKQIYFEDGVKDGYLVVEGKKIVGFLDKCANVEDYIDYSDYRIIPGIFDTHNHATHGYSPAGLKGGEKEVLGYLKGLASSGVTNVFPTIEYHKGTDSYHRLVEMSKRENDGATILGIHSEDTERLGHRVGENGIEIGERPIDMELVRDTWEQSEGMLKLCGIAPELPGADEAIAYLTSKGVRVAFMHSECNYEQAMEAFRKGVSVSTHTANVMRGIHHRRMGGLGACLLDPDLNTEIICDFLHISPEMIELMMRVKQNDDKWMMISDNVSVAGAPEGKYRPSDPESERYHIVTPEGFCLDPNGRLSGSTKPVLFGMKNLVTKLNKPLEKVIRMASLNPCRTYGFDKEKGSILLGKDADLVVIDDDYNCIATYANGRKVYDCKVDTDLFNEEFLKEYRMEE